MHTAYYKEMRSLAQEKRGQYALSTPEINLSGVRSIYKQEGIEIHGRKGGLKKLKAAYFNNIDGCCILLNMGLPEEPRLFAMLHELKHHYVDREHLKQQHCYEVYDSSPEIEIGAEVFAAEFIFPEEEFIAHVARIVPDGNITAEGVVDIKYSSPARVSYTFIIKTLERLRLIRKGQFKGVRFDKLHAARYGSAHFHNRWRI